MASPIKRQMIGKYIRAMFISVRKDVANQMMNRNFLLIRQPGRFNASKISIPGVNHTQLFSTNDGTPVSRN